MTLSTRNRWLLLACLAAAAPALAGTKTCYRKIDDADNDGYAKAGAVGLSVSVPEGMHCPAKYLSYELIDKAGDCNDFNSNIHPRTREQPGTLVDDNCDGHVDEPTPYYHPAGWSVTTSSFEARFNLNDQLVLQWAYAGLPVTADVWLQALNNSELYLSRKDLPVTHPIYPGYGAIQLTGLSPATVYKVQVRFKVCFFDCHYSEWSQPFYSTTTDLPKKSQVRTAMVLRALYEVGESDEGYIGYRGLAFVDGTQFGADYGEKWCSEFYSWIGNPYLSWSSPPSSTGAMLSAFGAAGATRPPSDIPVWADRGDYLALDLHNNDDVSDHSAMVLAWDPSYGILYTVEGNTSGNTAAVKTRLLSDVAGFGHLTYSLLR